MTFAEMLEHREDCYALREIAADELATARAVLADKEAADARAEEARLASDKAIHDLLAERGVHYIIGHDGTLSTYHAIDQEPGWMATHPIPGALPEGITDETGAGAE